MSAVHNEKAPFPIVCTVSGIINSCKLVHWLNASSPIDCSAWGKAILDKLLHPEKAKSPILVTLSGKVTPDNIGQLLNKLLGINVNAFGSFAVVRHGLSEKAPSAIVVTVSASDRCYVAFYGYIVDIFLMHFPLYAGRSQVKHIAFSGNDKIAVLIKFPNDILTAVA